MTKYCTECGTLNVDDANFCARCGFPFDECDYSPLDANAPLEIPRRYNSYNIKGTCHCFNCKQNSLIYLKKESVLSENIVYFCTNCGLTLEKTGYYYKLVDILDKNNPMWQSYRMKLFKKEEWEPISNGELSQKDQIKQDKEIEDLKEQLFQLELKRYIGNILPSLINGGITLPVIHSPVNLMDDEEAYVSLSNIILSEPETSNTSFKDSFKIAKGVTVNTSNKVTRVDNKKLKELDSGTFIITNRRVIFIGDEKTANIDLMKILSVNVFKDGISIQRENKKIVNYFTGTDQHNFTFKIKGSEQSLPLEGSILRAIILGQMLKL